MDERQELMQDRFNITLDDFLKEEVNTMASLGEDTYRHGMRIGREEGRTDEKVEFIVRLVTEEGWSVDKAMRFAKIADDNREVIEERVKSELSLRLKH